MFAMSEVLVRHIAAVDWLQVERDLEAQGVAVLPQLLDGRQCAALRGLYAHPQAFRSRVVMKRHGFGRGEYQYFAEPLPTNTNQPSEAASPASKTINRFT